MHKKIQKNCLVSEIIVPSSTFQQFFFRLTMPVVKVSSETGFF